MIVLLHWSIIHLLSRQALQCQIFGGGIHLLGFVKIVFASYFRTSQLCLMFHSSITVRISLISLKNNNEVFLINIAIPGDSRLSHKFAEKHSKYIDLKVEVTRVWKAKRVSTIPIIVGTFGSIPTDLSASLQKLDLPSHLIRTFQKTVLYSTTSIIRRFMSI